MTHATCRLTAKNRDQLRNPTLGNRAWATFYRLRETQFTDDESPKIAAEPWFESQNRKFYFQRINSLEEMLKNALMLHENILKNDSVCDIVC